MRRGLRMRMCAALLCLVIMLLTCANAVADESVQVSIPVIAFGSDCSVALFDEAGHRVQLLKLEEGVANAFVLQLTGLKRFIYRALVYDEHTDEVTFDRTNYHILIEVVYGADEKPMTLVYILDPHQIGAKSGRLEFTNQPIIPVTPTPTPTPAPTPTPIVTPLPYDKLFTFTKVWSGDSEDSIDWVFYNANGTQRHKLFNKYEVGEYEWRYEAYFQTDVDDCYIIEKPIKGYQVIYQNVGEYSNVTDRCHNGGTIINYKLPETGDKTPIADYTALVVLSMLGACLLVIRYRRHTASK